MTVYSVQAKVNSRSKDFKVTGGNPPAFLFKDPDNYDPRNGLSGLMHGYFLTRIRCFGSCDTNAK